MKTKLEMAHEYAINHMMNPQFKEADDLDVIGWAWDYVDAMQAEADKRAHKEPRETHKNLAEFNMHPEYDASINYPPDAWVMYKGEKRLAVSIDIKKEGKQNQKAYNAKCSKCNSVSRFSRLDGSIHRNKINREFLCVSCPVCQSDVWVDL